MSLWIFVIDSQRFVHKIEEFAIIYEVAVNIFDNQVHLTCFFEQLNKSVQCICCYFAIAFAVLLVASWKYLGDQVYSHVFLFDLYAELLQIICDCLFF